MNDIPETPQPMTRLLRRDHAAAYIRDVHGVPCSKNTLAKLATLGGGPQFRKFGPTPLYSPSDLDAWVKSRLSKRVASTAEYGEVA